jgi:ubiquinol-cytochrome c reductase cytochrome c subunit
MKTLRLAPAFAAAMICALAASGALAAAAAQPSSNAANGKALYTKYYCYSCHGTTGAGGGGAGPRLAPPPLPLQAFTNQLRHPNRMPPFTETVLTDAQVADIHAYLASIPRGKPPAEIPLLAGAK